MANEQMKDFVINGPDGNEYTVTAAADATDDELIAYVQDNLQQPEPTQAPSVPQPQTPQVGVELVPGRPDPTPQDATQAVETRIGNPYRDQGPSSLNEEDLQTYLGMVQDPNKSLDEINSFLRGRQMVATDQEALDKYRAAIAAGQPVSNTVEYTSMANDLLGNYEATANEVDNDFEAAVDNSMLTNPMNSGVTMLLDFMDEGSGGVSKDDIRAKYPDLTDDEVETVHDSLIGEHLRRMRGNAQKTVQDRDVNFGLQFGTDMVFGMSPVDIIPIARGGKIGQQLIEGAVTNTAADMLMQAGDVAYGAQSNWNPGQTVMAGTAGAALQGTFAATAKGYRRVTKTGEYAPTPQSPHVSVPTNKKGSKQYKVQIEQTVNDIAAAVDTVTSDWGDVAPSHTVHTNFSKMPKNIDRRAVAVYNGDGTVDINTEAVLKEAKRLDVEPGDIVRSAVFHEGLGHFSLQNKYGDELNDVLWDLYDNGSAKLRSDVDAWMKRNPLAYEGDPNREIKALEELMAETAERNGEIPVRIMDRIKDLIKKYARAMGMDWKVSGREVRAILASAQRDMKTGKVSRDLGGADPKYMYIGRNKSQLSSSDQMHLDEAETLEAWGTKPSSIKAQTGWHRAPDGKWRFELEDADMSFHSFDYTNSMDEDQLGFVQAMSEAYELPMYEIANDLEGRSLFEVIGDPKIHKKYDLRSAMLSDLIDHPRLFQAYPELQDVRVSREPSDSNGTYFPGQERINIDPEAPDPDSTLLHEIQHWVQDREGWATGGNLTSAVKDLPDNLVLEGSRNLSKHIAHEAKKSSELVQAAREIAQDPDSARIYTLKNLQETVREKAYGPKSKEGPTRDEARKRELEIFNEYTKLKQQLIQKYTGLTERELYDLNASPEVKSVRDDWEVIDRTLHIADKITGGRTRQERLQRLFKSAREDMIKSVAVRRMVEEQDINGLRSVIRGDRKAAYSAYQHLFGEVEARDTQNRYNFFKEGGSLHGKNRDDFDPYTTERATIEPDHYVFTDVNPDSLSTRNSDPKYMMPGRLDPRDMTADELFEAENAVDILRAVTEGADRTPLALDDLKAEAEARGFTSSDLLARAEQSPGDITKRLMMYDIAAEKLNDKLTKLYAKLNDGTATPTTKQEYLKTLAQFQDLTKRIFGEQSEAGRVLRALQELQYTRKKVEGIQGALAGMQNALDSDEAFAKFAARIQEGLNESQGKKSKLGEVWANLFNTPRAVMSSMDFSAPFRQGIFLIGRKEFWKNIPGMFKYFSSEDAHASMWADITSRDTYATMQKAGISFTNNESRLAAREEDFMSEWADKVPLVERSNRAYGGYLNKLRADVFDSIYKSAKEAGIDLADDPKALKALGSYVNAATGRGSLGQFNSAAPQLTTIFFSPRLIASRLELLSMPFRPSFYTSLPAPVRKAYLRDLASLGTAALAVTGIAAQAGLEVEVDPRSSDFGKIKVGDTRYDILGGFGQYITLGARLATFLGGSAYEKATGDIGPDHYKTTSTGTTKKYNDGDGMYDQKAGDVPFRFLRNKLAPVPSYIVDGLYGENVVGEDFDVAGSALQRMIPMYAQDVWEMAQEEGPVKGTAMAVPGMFGVGIQNFRPSNTDPEAEIEFSGKWTDNSLEDGENDQISVKDGEVRIKDPAVLEEWNERMNELVREWMKDEMADPSWETKTDKEKEDIIKEVRNDARRETKKEMTEMLGL